MERVAEDVDESVRSKVLAEIVDLYVTVRGFSFAKSWLEIYKQDQSKETVAKVKESTK